MSLGIAGIGAVQPVHAPFVQTAPYAQNHAVAQSVAGTTAGAESGAASVVYEPGSSEAEQQLTYSNRDPANRAAALAAAASSGDGTIVAATGGDTPSPQQLPDVPVSAPAHQPQPASAGFDPAARPAMADPAASSGAAHTFGAAEASAQASYAAVVDAMIAGASAADVEKYA